MWRWRLASDETGTPEAEQAIQGGICGNFKVNFTLIANESQGPALFYSQQIMPGKPGPQRLSHSIRLDDVVQKHGQKHHPLEEKPGVCTRML